MINRVHELRKQKKLTQQGLGNLVGVSRQAVAAIEKGRFDPSVWLAYDLSRVFSISIEELFDFERSERK
ncbi:MAG: helix-turn-helix transcriptional regulator [Acetatifactor sp.]|nr:helix-turn-helix transcriptional regulator [Acetatifactor sp.]